MTLDEDNFRVWARKEGFGDRKLAELVTEPKVRALVQGYLDQLNAREHAQLAARVARRGVRAGGSSRSWGSASA